MQTQTAGCPLGAKCEDVKTDSGEQVLHRCPWYIMVRGRDVNTGNEVDDWGCAIAWMPMLTIENSNMQRQTGAAVESFRNEMVRANDSNRDLLLAAAGGNARLIQG